MIGPPAITKNTPRGKPFQKYQSGNSRGRPTRTAEEFELLEACRQKTSEALEVIENLMDESTQDRVRIAAASLSSSAATAKHPTGSSCWRRRARFFPVNPL